jgi:pimeloyl-ACP methyl ester carboxylesterase
MKDSIAVFTDFIEQVYNEKASARHGNGGIILVGHSLGAAFSLSIAYEARDRLPLLGVSSLGCVPVENSIPFLPVPDPEPHEPRFVVETTPESVRRYMGEVEWINLDALEPTLIAAVFEPSA